MVSTYRMIKDDQQNCFQNYRFSKIQLGKDYVRFILTFDKIIYCSYYRILYFLCFVMFHYELSTGVVDNSNNFMYNKLQWINCPLIASLGHIFSFYYNQTNLSCYLLLLLLDNKHHEEVYF